MHTFPHIGLDPLAHRDQVKGGVEGARERLEKVTALQQDGVPDQTALVWRIDVDRVLCELTWRSCHLEPLKQAHARIAELESNHVRLMEALEKHVDDDQLEPVREAMVQPVPSAPMPACPLRLALESARDELKRQRTIWTGSKNDSWAVAAIDTELGRIERALV